MYHQIGSGKTCTAITLAEAWMDAHPSYKTVVVLPARLKTNFEDELMGQCGMGTLHVCRGTDRILGRGHYRSAPKGHPQNIRRPRQSKIRHHVLVFEYLINSAHDSFKLLGLTATPIFDDVRQFVDLVDVFNPAAERPQRQSIKATNCESMEARLKTIKNNNLQNLYMQRPV